MERFAFSALAWLLMLLGAVTLWNAYTVWAVDKRIEGMRANAPLGIRQQIPPDPPSTGTGFVRRNLILAIAEFIVSGAFFYFW